MYNLLAVASSLVACTAAVLLPLGGPMCVPPSMASTLHQTHRLQAAEIGRKKCDSTMEAQEVAASIGEHRSLVRREIVPKTRQSSQCALLC